MKSGDIVFVYNKSVLSRIIRFFDKGKFTHVAIAVSDTEVFEAQYYTKARITEMKYKNYEIVNLGIEGEDIPKLVGLCKSLEGRWYDYLQILSYILQRVFNHTELMFNNPNMLICSEAVSLILSELKVTNKTFGDTTPNELYNKLQTISTSQAN
jgi:hypothetical protein